MPYLYGQNDNHGAKRTMKTITQTTLTGGMKFVAKTGSGHEVVMDARQEVGGEDSGPRPAELPFVGLSACTGMDTISILRKMRQEPDEFSVDVEGVDRTEEHPKYWKRIRVTFHVKGDVDEKKLVKAIDLSRTRYCGVSTIMQPTVTIDYRYVLNGDAVDLGESTVEE